MAEFLANWGQAILNIVLESAPWVLLGLAVAGLFQVFLPADRVTRHLGRDDLRSVVLATLFGAPLPLCSCSVVPAAVELRRKGASKGATTAFLISTPETGIDQMGITYALLDPIMMFARPLAGIATSIGAGSLVNWMARRGIISSSDPLPATVPTSADPCCASEAPAASHAHDHGSGHDSDHAHDHSHDHVHEGLPAPATGSLLQRLISAMKYAFGPMLAELTPWFLLGFALSGLIEIVVPEGFFGDIIPGGIVAILLMLVISAPMYVCATASTPVAAVMIAKGLEPGAALVFMLAGPASNVGTMLIVGKMLGKRVLAAYLGMIALAAIVFGLGLNWLYAGLDIDLAGTVRNLGTKEVGFLTYASSALFLGGMLFHAWRQSLLASCERSLANWGVVPAPRFVRYALLLIALAAWSSTALSVVAPGQTGFVTRFGRLAETIVGPGYAVHLPYPIDRFEIVATGTIERAEVGGEESAPPEVGGMVLPMDGGTSASEVECVTGDEKLLLVSYTVHYHALDAYEWKYAIRDLPALVTACSQAAIRRMVGRRSMDEHLIERREPLEHETRGYIQDGLSQVTTGIEVLDVNLEYIHAPSQVHFAYRDVASSLEDKQTAVKNGEAYAKEWLAQTRGEADKMLEEAAGERATRIAQAQGAVASFIALCKVANAAGAPPGMLREHLSWQSQLRSFVKPALTALVARNVQVIANASSDGGSARAASQAEDR